MRDQIFMLANLLIMIAYAAITVAIAVPVARAGQLWTNKLATTTALIFFSCSFGHGLHALMAYRTIVGTPGMEGMAEGSPMLLWMSALWDLFTAAVGLYYWTLRRNYAILLGKGAMYVDPWGQHRLAEADARERAARDVAETQRATLATVVEHSDDAIIGLTPEGIITAWNGGAERVFGYAADEVLGRPAVVLADDTGAGQQAGVLARIRRGEHGVAYETRRLRKDGTRVDVSLTVTPIHDQAGTVVGVSAVGRDITAAKELAERQRVIQERTQQAQRMESLGKLAGGVAHDFNNILAIIRNYTDFAVAETAALPHVQADLEQVSAAVDRAIMLTRQLLTFTRADAVQPRDVDLNTVVAEVAAMLTRVIGEHITVITTPAPVPAVVRADPGQLHQVLLNLVINARDAMPDGGTLVVEVNTADVEGTELNLQPPLAAGRYARLLVSDTGEGMPPDVAAHVFEPFFTTKPAGKGTGLGLATVYGIVTEAGGSIGVYSEPGVGTTLRIYLPLVTAAADPAPAAPHQGAPPPGAGRRVLVVEDEVTLARVIHRILSDGGYHVVSAPDGPQALTLFEQYGCDVLLTDVIMPEMSGPALAERLRERRPDLPVLYMSGYSNGLLGNARLIDCDVAFIEKPFTATALLHRLAAVCAAPRRAEPCRTGPALPARDGAPHPG